MEAFSSLDTARDLLLGCMFNFYTFGLLTSLYIAYVSLHAAAHTPNCTALTRCSPAPPQITKHFLDSLAVKILLVAVAALALTQTSLSVVIALTVLRHLQEPRLRLNAAVDDEVRALQALYSACTVLVSSYFILRIYKAIKSLVTAVILALFAAAGFVLRLAFVSLAFRVDASGRLSHGMAHQLVNVQWSQSILDAILSSAITIILCMLVVRHRHSHGPAWHVPVLRSLLLETAFPVLPLVLAQSSKRLFHEPLVATMTSSNALVVCLLLTLWNRPTVLVSLGLEPGSPATTAAHTADAGHEEKAADDNRRSSISRAPFSVGGLTGVQAPSLEPVGAGGLEGHAEARPTNGVHGNSGHSPSCPSPRHQWRFS